MKVIGVGYLRTGTTSLTLALEQLGFGPCYHMRVVNREPSRAEDWLAALENPSTVVWDKVFRGFQSTVGSPGCDFWIEITDAYPQAKVILSMRSAQSWYDSAAQTVVAAMAAAALPRPGPAPAALDRLQQLTWAREFGPDFDDRDHVIEVFNRHVSAVQQRISADRLLMFQAGDGWPPLCEFLEVPIPSTPFPHENDRATFRRRQDD